MHGSVYFVHFSIKHHKEQDFDFYALSDMLLSSPSPSNTTHAPSPYPHPAHLGQVRARQSTLTFRLPAEGALRLCKQRRDREAVTPRTSSYTLETHRQQQHNCGLKDDTILLNRSYSISKTTPVLTLTQATLFLKSHHCKYFMYYILLRQFLFVSCTHTHSAYFHNRICLNTDKLLRWNKTTLALNFNI